MIKIFLLTLMKTNHKFFKMDPYFPQTLPATFLNYLTQRKEENEKYNFPDLTKFSFPNFAQDAYEIAGAV